MMVTLTQHVEFLLIRSLVPAELIADRLAIAPQRTIASFARFQIMQCVVHV